MSKPLQGSLVDKDVVSIYMYKHMHGIYKYDSGGYKGEGEDPFWVIYTRAALVETSAKVGQVYIRFSCILKGKDQ